MARALRLHVQDFGPIRKAVVELGDLTVVVGPQAAGKSLFLQLLNLLIDRPSIVDGLKKNNLRWDSDPAEFFRIYFGEGLSGLWTDQTDVTFNGRTLRRNQIASARGKPRQPRVFYVPAQRVMALRDGITHPFSDFRDGDPFVVRSFSDNIHRLVQTEFAGRDRLFPLEGRMNEAIRRTLTEALFGSFELRLDRSSMQRRFVLKRDNAVLPFMNWSAGQREFAPLLMGLLWLMPAGGAQRREGLELVLIEEPEMGLHPRAISAFLLVTLELLRRGYRVCLSTHSPHVLDVVWALQVLRQFQGEPKHVRMMFGLKATPFVDQIAKEALKKSYRTYYFPSAGPAADISALDPGHPEEAVRGWGGLTSFTANIGDVVAEVVSKGNVNESPQKMCR